MNNMPKYIVNAHPKIKEDRIHVARDGYFYHERSIFSDKLSDVYTEMFKMIINPDYDQVFMHFDMCSQEMNIDEKKFNEEFNKIRIFCRDTIVEIDKALNDLRSSIILLEENNYDDYYTHRATSKSHNMHNLFYEFINKLKRYERTGLMENIEVSEKDNEILQLLSEDSWVKADLVSEKIRYNIRTTMILLEKLEKKNLLLMSDTLFPPTRVRLSPKGRAYIDGLR